MSASMFCSARCNTEHKFAIKKKTNGKFRRLFAKTLDLRAETTFTADEHEHGDYTGIKSCNLTCWPVMLSKKGTREAFSLTVLHPDTEKLINHKHA